MPWQLIYANTSFMVGLHWCSETEYYREFKGITIQNVWEWIKTFADAPPLNSKQKYKWSYELFYVYMACYIDNKQFCIQVELWFTHFFRVVYKWFTSPEIWMLTKSLKSELSSFKLLFSKYFGIRIFKIYFSEFVRSN